MHLSDIKKILAENICLGKNPENNFELMPLKVQDLVLEINNKSLLKNINFEFDRKSLTVLMGANGAGKSLLLKVINGILEQTSGKVLWCGNKITNLIRSEQAFVFQQPVLLRRSVSSNLKFVQKIFNVNNRSSRDNLLKMVGLFDKRNQSAKSLSIGEQQRLVIIRALLSNPKIIFLDEPTANLDPTSVALIEKVVLAVKEMGIKIVFVTHDLHQAKRLADEILFIDKGEILEHTDADQFFIKPKSSVAFKYIKGQL